jgi:hypothetical protein
MLMAAFTRAKLEHHLRISRDQSEKIEHHESLKAELLREA